MNTVAARDFLARSFRTGDTIAVLLRREHPASTLQRIVRFEQAIAPAYLRWLVHENSAGANIYVAANPLHSGSRRRTKESIAEVRHLYLDIDSDGDTRIAALRASQTTPVPNTILSTSPSKYQVLWDVDGFDFASQEHTLKLLALTFGGDPACTDCNRVLRVPGFKNCKYTPTHLVTAEYLSDSVSHPADFQIAPDLAETIPLLRAVSPRSPARKRTNSEQDWAWVLRELANGKDEVQLADELASRRSDKPNPRYYAQRTVDIASARLALLAGNSIGNIITTVEERRRGDLPGPLCSARAWEIAHTAARRIARTKIT